MANVAPKDLAILVHPVLPENKDKICTIVQQIPSGAGTIWPEGSIIWLCEYRTGIKTTQFDEYGLVSLSSTEDWRLRRIAGPSVDIMQDTVLNAPEELVTSY